MREYCSAKIFSAACLGIVLMLSSAASSRAVDRAPTSDQILDAALEPLYWVRFDLTPDNDFEEYGEAAAAELEAGWDLAYFYPPQGEIDLKLHFRLIGFSEEAGSNLPDGLFSVALNGGWTFREDSGTALQFRLAPGIYSETDGIGKEWFNAPGSVALIRTLHPTLSAIVGAEMWPGHEHPVIPLVGFKWAVTDTLHLKAQLPESRLDWFVTHDWSTSVGLQWRVLGFDLQGDGSRSQDRIDMEELRAYWGVTRQVTDSFHLMGRIGFLFDRRIDYGNAAEGVPESIDIDNAWLIGFGCGGPF